MRKSNHKITSSEYITRKVIDVITGTVIALTPFVLNAYENEIKVKIDRIKNRSKNQR